MASSVPAPYSTALYRITYAWGLAFAPHALKIILLGNSGYKWDNKIGRANMSRDASRMRIDEASLARARRADAAHQNGNESYPLFAAAVLAAAYAGVSGDEVEKWSKVYLLTRLVYNVLFITGASDGVAGLRTLVWGTSVYSSITLILRAARALAAKGL